MDWIKIVLVVCIIIQEIQIIYLRKDIEDIHDFIAQGLMDKLKISVMNLDIFKDDNEDKDNKER